MVRKDTIRKTVKKTVQTTTEITDKLADRLQGQINAKLGVNSSAELRAKINESVQQAAQTAQLAAGAATSTAKFGIDQALIALEHRGINIKDPQDLAQRVGRKVLERAEAIRAQIADKPFTPAWLKDVSLTPKETTVTPSATEAAGAAPVEAGMKPDGVCEVTQETLSAASPSDASADGVAPKSDLEIEEDDAKPAKKKRTSVRSKSSSRTSH